MISDLLDSAGWILALSASIAIASWMAHRSYRAFLQKSRGPASAALPTLGPATPIDIWLDTQEHRHPGQNGLRLLLNNQDAFAARAGSAAQAGRSLDLMYYIWRTDLSGWMLIDALVAAADRGVRIRLLLDDVNVQGFDRTFLALAQLPQIEVRLFNPIRNRANVVRRVVEMALGLARFNRRMHGKLWIVDGRLAIIGGRNIGDTYFSADAGDNAAMSVDADVQLVGPKVAEVSALFDNYWNMGLSLPIAALWPAFTVNQTAFRKRVARQSGTAKARAFAAHLPDIASLTAPISWSNGITLLADPPDKAYGLHSAPWISTAVSRLLDAATSDVHLITPYFVPGDAGLTALMGHAARGVQITLLTNALSATDKVVVFGAYAQYRHRLLQAGAAVFEFARPPLGGGKRDVLHAKVFIIDRKTAIIGSLNFDLRSAFMNTELGLMFTDPVLIAQMIAEFDDLSAAKNAYHVTAQGQRLQWNVQRPGLLPVMRTDPEARWQRRLSSWIVGHLPIKRYL